MGADLISAIRPALKELLDGSRKEGDWCAEFAFGEDPSTWIQVIPDAANFSYPFQDEPLSRLQALGIALIPGTEVVAFEAGKFATLSIGAFDLEQVTRFVDALLTRFYLMSDDAPLDVRLVDLS